MKRRWRRRNYFIKKELQGRYIFNFFIFVIAGSILFSLIFSYLSFNTLTVVYKDYNLQIGKTPLILFKEILSAHWIFIFTIGISIVIISMFLTHRFAGPMYRFEKSVEEMINGNFNFEIRLRKRDEGKELAEKMNQLIDLISSRFKEMRYIFDELNSKNALVTQLIKQQENKSVIPEIEKIISLNGKLRDLLYSFKIKNDD